MFRARNGSLAAIFVTIISFLPWGILLALTNGNNNSNSNIHYYAAGFSAIKHSSTIRLQPHDHLLKMAADATTSSSSSSEAATASTTTATTMTTDEMTPTAPIVSNRLFLSHIDYTNHYDDSREIEKNSSSSSNNNNNNNNSSSKDDLSPEVVKQRLEKIFSRFGVVQEIYLSEKDKTTTDPGKAERPPFAFIAMETAEEARAALKELGGSDGDGDGDDRRLFRTVAPAKVHKSKHNKQNKSERLRSERLQEYRQRLAFVVGGGDDDAANVVCQVHTSHLDRLRDFAAAQPGVDLVGSFSALKGTSFVMLRAGDKNNKKKKNINNNDDDDDNDDNDGNSQDNAPERLSRTLWDTWFVAPNLNRVTVMDPSADSNTKKTNSVVEGNLRNGVVPAIADSLSKIGASKVSLRVAVYPPKLQRALLDALEDYRRHRHREYHGNGNGVGLEIELSPSNPTHTISVIQLHPGVVVTPKSKGDNDKALYVLGRVESVPSTRKRSLDDNDNGNCNDNDNKYQLQQQSTSLVPQPKKQITVGGKDTATTTCSTTTTTSSPHLPLATGNSAAAAEATEDKSISRAYWKLQEAWERYEHGAPSLTEPPPRSNIANEQNQNQKNHPRLWALDCGAAPGGWTKFLFRPGVVERIYAVDPGALSPDVVPGLDERFRAAGNPQHTNVVRHVEATIQASLPSLVSDLQNGEIASESETASETNTNTNTSTNRFLDVWVSDMCVKDVSGQIDCFLAAREAGVVGSGTFFVLTLKCVVGYSATAFEYQTREQVSRLSGISRDVQVVHLCSNRSSERTVIGYLV